MIQILRLLHRLRKWWILRRYSIARYCVYVCTIKNIIFCCVAKNTKSNDHGFGRQSMSATCPRCKLTLKEHIVLQCGHKLCTLCAEQHVIFAQLAAQSTGSIALDCSTCSQATMIQDWNLYPKNSQLQSTCTYFIINFFTFS